VLRQHQVLVCCTFPLYLVSFASTVLCNKAAHRPLVNKLQGPTKVLVQQEM
jgi:hypothetical protein